MLQTRRKGDWWETLTPRHWEGKSIEQILKLEWQTPKSLLHQFRMGKSVKVNGKWLPWNYELKNEDRFQIQLFPDEEIDMIPDYVSIDLIYEDDHILIVNKPAGMATHPTSKDQNGTLANAVAAYFEQNGIQTRVRYIHRLDYDTSGGIIFAKHALAGSILDRLLANRAIKRTYYAFVQGILKQKKGVIDEPIGRDRHHATRRRVSPTGDQAKTEFRVIESYASSKATLVELRLQTGRTHQIRVHMSHIGHPILGDELYGGSTNLIVRQALHAERIQIPHPFLDELLDLHIPMPEDLLELKAKLKSSRRG